MSFAANFLDDWKFKHMLLPSITDENLRAKALQDYEAEKIKRATGKDPMAGMTTSANMMSDPYVVNSNLPNNTNSIANTTPEMANLLNVISNQKNADEMQNILRSEYASRVGLENKERYFNSVISPTNQLQVNSTLALANMNNNTFLRGKQIDNEGLMAIASAIGGRSSLADALIARMPEAPRP